MEAQSFMSFWTDVSKGTSQHPFIRLNYDIFSAANVPTASGFCATRKGIPLETFTATQTVPEAAQKSVQKKKVLIKLIITHFDKTNIF